MEPGNGHHRPALSGKAPASATTTASSVAGSVRPDSYRGAPEARIVSIVCPVTGSDPTTSRTMPAAAIARPERRRKISNPANVSHTAGIGQMTKMSSSVRATSVSLWLPRA